jgi:hypothetical protein
MQPAERVLFGASDRIRRAMGVEARGIEPLTS